MQTQIVRDRRTCGCIFIFTQGRRRISHSNQTTQGNALTEIPLPDGLESLGNYVFQDTPGLRKLRLPASLNVLGEQALYIGSGSHLYAIHTAADNPAYVSVDGVLFSKDMTKLIKYPSAKRPAIYRVPETITEIAGDAFAHTNYLHRIELPKSLRVLGSGAFSFCNHIEELVIPETVEGIPSYAFFCCERMERLILPSRVAYLGYESICNCSMLRELKLPSGFTQPDYAAVGGNERLEELVIPEGVTELNNSALIDNTGLRRIVLPSTLTAIWDHAFQRCSSLEEIVIPENVEYIDDEAFLGCIALKRVYMKSAHIKDNHWLPDDLKDRVKIEFCI